MTTERALKVGTGDDRKVGGRSWTKFEKKGVGVGNTEEVFIK